MRSPHLGFSERHFSHPDEAAPPRRVIGVVDDSLGSILDLLSRGERRTELLPRIVILYVVLIRIEDHAFFLLVRGSIRSVSGRSTRAATMSG